LGAGIRKMIVMRPVYEREKILCYRRKIGTGYATRMTKHGGFRGSEFRGQLSKKYSNKISAYLLHLWLKKRIKLNHEINYIVVNSI
jgi:hypothetical protein